MYQNPTDPTYIRFWRQVDGSPELPYRAYEIYGNNRSENEGFYLVSSGKFLNNKLFLIGGFRQDGSVFKRR